MALGTGTVVGSYLGSAIVEDTLLSGSAAVTAQDITSSGGSIFQIYIDNSLNTNQQVYLKMFQLAASAVTSTGVGTAAPDFIFPCAGGAIRQFDFPEGLSFAPRLSMYLEVSPGTTGSTGPTNNVTVRITRG